MTREEAENKILELAIGMQKVIAEYYPQDDVLSLSIRGDYIGFNNRYWKRKKKGILNFNTYVGSVHWLNDKD